MFGAGAFCALLAFSAQAQQTRLAGKPPPNVAESPLGFGQATGIEPTATELLKAMSGRLATASSMTFDATAECESQTQAGGPAATTVSHVVLQRPDKLQVTTLRDRSPPEFFYDGTRMVALSPDQDLAAAAPAPPTIDAMLKFAFDTAAIYFPFNLVIVADPYRDADGLTLASAAGKFQTADGVETEVVVLKNDLLQAEVWIGATDKLPRRLRAAYSDEPGEPRHVVEFSNWHLDVALRAGSFAPILPMSMGPVAFVPSTRIAPSAMPEFRDEAP